MSINCSSMLACPTCGPNCNYECEDGVCVSKPRDDNRVGVSKTRGVPSKGSTNYGPRGQRQNFRSFTGTNWQQAGRNRETMWQNGGVFSNASGRGRYLPTGMDRRATPNASNQWLAAMPGRVGGPLGPRPADPPLSRRAGGGGKPLSPVDVRFRYASGELQEKQVMKMSVAKLVMGYLGIGLTAFVIGYAIRKGGTAAK